MSFTLPVLWRVPSLGKAAARAGDMAEAAMRLTRL